MLPNSETSRLPATEQEGLGGQIRAVCHRPRARRLLARIDYNAETCGRPGEEGYRESLGNVVFIRREKLNSKGGKLLQLLLLTTKYYMYEYCYYQRLWSTALPGNPPTEGVAQTCK
jgi:hypothetical protein